MLWISLLALLVALSWAGLWLHPARPWDFQPVDEAAPRGDEAARAAWPDVCVLVPARNEAETLPETLPALLGQTYPGRFRIVLVDDRSDDETAAVARRIAEEQAARGRLQIVDGAPLPPAWSGKIWALEQGARAAFGTERAERAERAEETDPGEATGDGAAYVMLTDADIIHTPDSLARLVRDAEAKGLGMTSRMARLRCESFWERLLIPAFVYFFNLLYPMRQVNDPTHPMAAAAGGCVLLSRAAYEAIGGLTCIRDELIDDVNLARNVKGKGFPIRLSLSSEAVRSERGYDTLGPIWRMVRRTAFTELGYSWLKLAGTLVGLSALFVLPVAATLAGLAAVASGAGGAAGAGLLAAGTAALGLMAWTYRPAVRFYRIGAPFCFALPAIATLYALMTLDSALRYALGMRSAWRGRTYSTAAEEAATP